MAYRGYTIEKERDGSFSVYHPVYHYIRNLKTEQACKQHIDAMLADR